MSRPIALHAPGEKDLVNRRKLWCEVPIHAVALPSELVKSGQILLIHNPDKFIQEVNKIAQLVAAAMAGLNRAIVQTVVPAIRRAVQALGTEEEPTS